VSFWETVWRFITLMRPADFVDIIIVAFALYKGVKLVRETRAQQLVKAVVILILILWGSTLLRLHSITYILENVMQVGFLALLIIFQPELRRMLEKVGRSKIGNIFTSAPENIDRMVDELADAATYLSAHKIGALVVLERGTKIGEIVTTGTALSADLTSALLINIFIPNTPLHDGAVVIQEGRISAAGCLLPLTQNDSLSRELGTRHRAALGMTEISDAVVLVVSEETGKISIARDGDMVRNLTEDSLRRALYKNLAEEEAAKPVEELRKWKEAFRWKKK